VLFIHILFIYSLLLLLKGPWYKSHPGPLKSQGRACLCSAQPPPPRPLLRVCSTVAGALAAELARAAIPPCAAHVGKRCARRPAAAPGEPNQEGAPAWGGMKAGWRSCPRGGARARAEQPCRIEGEGRRVAWARASARPARSRAAEGGRRMWCRLAKGGGRMRRGRPRRRPREQVGPTTAPQLALLRHLPA